MKKKIYFLSVLFLVLCMVGCKQNEPTDKTNSNEGNGKNPSTETIVDGVQGNVLVNAVFQINSKGDKVRFSKGNLQFNAAQGTHKCADGTTQKGTWRFAEHQWDYVGDSSNGNVNHNGTKCDNANISETYDGWIDLFGWGTSGWNNTSVDKYYIHYQPWATSTEDYYFDNKNKYSYDYNFYGYGPSTNKGTGDLTGVNAYGDWGVYNQIGSDAPGTWRTLTSEEWQYIFDHSKYIWTNVCGSNGIVLVSSDWQKPDGVEWGAKEYFANDWGKMQANGAVFLPSGGCRSGSSVYDVGLIGYFWSVSQISSRYAWYLYFNSGNSGMGSPNRYLGKCVRLSQDL